VEPILQVKGLNKVYTHGVFKRQTTFNLNADFTIEKPEIVGVMGPNGSGKTTLFELMSGSNIPTAGNIICSGQDIHRVKYRERDRMIIHYHQSYQVRRVKKTVPNFMLEDAMSDYPLVHVFDEPQFSTQDGYIGFMLNFFRHLKSHGRVVFLCLHPCEPFHVDIMRDNCERYLFVQKGQVTEKPDYESFLAHPGVRDYLVTAYFGNK
jgi:ABC-type multidrug transport system ATPase subunit